MYRGPAVQKKKFYKKKQTEIFSKSEKYNLAKQGNKK